MTARPSLPYSLQPYTVERPFTPIVRRIRKVVRR